MALNGTVTNVFTELYAGTDFSSLSYLEQKWVWWYVTIGNPIVATGLMSFLLHEVRPRVSLSKNHKLNQPLDRLLWTKHTMDNHRRHAVLPTVEVAA